MKQLARLIHLEAFIAFTREYSHIIVQIRGVIIALLVLVMAGGAVLMRAESMPFWDGQYLAFVTALTIGYGDLTPGTPLGKLTSITLGVIGMILMGLVVGAASVAVRRAFEREKGGDGNTHSPSSK